MSMRTRGQQGLDLGGGSPQRMTIVNTISGQLERRTRYYILGRSTINQSISINERFIANSHDGCRQTGRNVDIRICLNYFEINHFGSRVIEWFLSYNFLNLFIYGPLPVFTTLFYDTLKPRLIIIVQG